MTGRLQLALNVNDLDESISFYSKLFGAEPAKVRPGYANFAIADPPLKLILMESRGRGGSLNHLGVEVADADAVDAEQARLSEAGLAAVDERDTTCDMLLGWVVGTLPPVDPRQEELVQKLRAERLAARRARPPSGISRRGPGRPRS